MIRFIIKGLLFSTLLDLSLCTETPSTAPVVSTANGKLLGRWQISRSGKRFSSFEGIPYAKPPQRFKSPEEPGNWSGIYNATYPRAFCPQFEDLTRIYYDKSEDCLHLQVFAPEKINPNESIATMVWIHGGGFLYGAGSVMGPRYIMDKHVILVTVNYRLGAFGFLNSGDELIKGNMGFKDMIMALKWVQRNIRFFGGDPKNVTLFGESAGGAAAHSLMLSPAAKGLFHKVIAQSGTAFCPWNLTPDPEAIFLDLARRVQCRGEKREILKCLEAKPVFDILEAHRNYTFGSTIDFPPLEGDFTVFPDTFENLWIDGDNSQNLPFIVGRNQYEGLLQANVLLSIEYILEKLNKDWRGTLPYLLNYATFFPTAKARDQVSDAILDFYFNGNKIFEYKKESIEALENVFTDLYFAWGTKRAASLNAKAGGTVYPYVFEFNGTFSLTNLLAKIETTGPVHADDLQYLFQSLLQPTLNWPDLERGSREEKFSENLINLWVSFAQSGVPSVQGWGSEWKPIRMRQALRSDGPLNWYILAETPVQMKESKEMVERMRFWDTVLNV